MKTTELNSGLLASFTFKITKVIHTHDRRLNKEYYALKVFHLKMQLNNLSDLLYNIRKGRYQRQEVSKLIPCTFGRLQSYFSALRNIKKNLFSLPVMLNIPKCVNISHFCFTPQKFQFHSSFPLHYSLYRLSLFLANRMYKEGINSVRRLR